MQLGLKCLCSSKFQHSEEILLYQCSTLGSIQDIIVYKILNNFKCYFFRDHSLPVPHHFKWNWKNSRFRIAGWHLYCLLERDSPYTVRRCEFSMHTFQATFWVLISRILSEKSKCISFISLSPHKNVDIPLVSGISSWILLFFFRIPSWAWGFVVITGQYKPLM